MSRGVKSPAFLFYSKKKLLEIFGFFKKKSYLCTVIKKGDYYYVDIESNSKEDIQK